MCACTLIPESEENSEKNSFKRKVLFENQSSTYVEQYIVSCCFCKLSFNKVEDCQKHSCNPVDDKSAEPLPKKIILEEHFIRHFKNNCNHCNVKFASRKDLSKHLKTKHNISEPDKFHFCSFCEKKFFQKSSLIKHMKVHASQQYNQHIKAHEKHICDSCSVTFSTEKLLNKHKKSVHNLTINKKHVCYICKKRFDRPSLLSVHQRVHTGEKPLKCYDCNKHYYSSESLSKHYKSIMHLKKVSFKVKEEVKIEKNFECDKCNAKFFRLQSLQRHKEILHTTGVLLNCKECNYASKSKANFKRHSELHSQIKRFSCNLCDQAFRTLVTLKDHLVFVHSDERNFPCDICEKSFKSKSDLKRHKKCHNDDRPYKCNCSQSFKRASHLKRHLENSGHQINSIEKLHNENCYVNSCDAHISLLEDVENDSCDGNLNFIERNHSEMNNNFSDIYLENQKDSISFLGSKEDKILINNSPEISENNTCETSDNITSQSTMPIMLDLSTLVADDTKLSSPKSISKCSSLQQPVLTLRNSVSSEVLTVPQLKKVLETPVFEQAMMLLTDEASDTAASSVPENPIKSSISTDITSLSTNIQIPLINILETNERTNALKLTSSLSEPAVSLAATLPKHNATYGTDQVNVALSDIYLLSQNFNVSENTSPFSVINTAEKSPSNTTNFSTQSPVSKHSVDYTTCEYVALPSSTDTTNSILEKAVAEEKSKILENSIVELQSSDNYYLSIAELLNAINSEALPTSMSEKTSDVLSAPKMSEFSDFPDSISNFLSQSQTMNSMGDFSTTNIDAAVPVTTSSLFDTFVPGSDLKELNNQLPQENADLMFSLPPYYNDSLFGPDYLSFISSINNDMCDRNSNNVLIHTDVNLNSTVCDAAVSSAPNTSSLFTTKSLETSNELVTNDSVENSCTNSLFYSFL